MGTLTEDTLREANAYGVAQHKTMTVISSTETKPSYLLGTYPRAQVEFRCVAPGDAAKPSSGTAQSN